MPTAAGTTCFIGREPQIGRDGPYEQEHQKNQLTGSQAHDPFRATPNASARFPQTRCMRRSLAS